MYYIITASPNTDGLTAACGKAAYDGIKKAGGEAEIIDISALKLEPCLICGKGWGTCMKAGSCVIKDKLSEIQLNLKAAEGIFIISPVYFGQMSERAKYFTDRLRRCESFREGGSWLEGKPIYFVAAAGGSGNGTATCLTEMENWCRHVHALPCDRIGITQYTREDTLQVIEHSGAMLVKGDYFKGFNR